VNAEPAGAPPADFHLVESHGQWQLTVRDLARLTAGQPVTVTVQVEPTLLPSGPFKATLCASPADQDSARSS
jgi:hypothetical protein